MGGNPCLVIENFFRLVGNHHLLVENINLPEISIWRRAAPSR